MKIHVDTDLGGDPDDVCALAMLLGLQRRGEVEIVGITTVADAGGRRAGWVEHVLDLAPAAGTATAPRPPVVAGAATSMTTSKTPDSIDDDASLWPATVQAKSARPGEALALDLIARNIDDGATVVAIGMLTNLALLEVARPGTLANAASIVVMGGWLEPPHESLPQWGPEMDWNVQCDTTAARIVCERATNDNLTMATLAATLAAPLRRDDLPVIRATGPLGVLIAQQSERVSLGTHHADVPDDVVNFHYDPVACALAAGWDAATTRRRTISPALDDDTGVLRFVDDPNGTPTNVLTDVDGDAFREFWLATLP